MNATPVSLTIGVLGGMGPQATADFMSEVIARTPATGDGDHLRMLIDCNPKVPDRQAAISGDDAAVRAVLADMARNLEAQGADFLVMPCNTAHAFIGDAVAAVSIPFISIIDVTIAAVRSRYPEARRVALLATDACIASGTYAASAERAGLALAVPTDADQRECMALIAAVKAGDTGTAIRARMMALARRVAVGADALIAGCTEIPLVLEGDVDGVPLLSSTDELAQASVDYGLGRLPLPVRPID